MKNTLGIVIVALLFVIGGAIVAKDFGDDDLESIVRSLDSAIVALRRGGNARTLISSAERVYTEKFAQAVEEADNNLHQKIVEFFNTVSTRPAEENIFALRRMVVGAGGLVGAVVSPVYSHAVFVIAIITFLLSLGITLVTKRVINWELVHRYRAEISQFMREYREVLRRQDRKRLHKLEPQLREIRQKNMVLMTETMKPALYYFIPLVVLWYLLAGVFRGWVVAWLPFTVSLPIYGKWVACGFGWWYLLTFLVFSTLLRTLLLPEESAPPSGVPAEGTPGAAA
jgi:uncharacterized membrane protein (DUF106 family)